MRLENKVIIVTGSTTGIGKAIALQCVEEGARVVIHGLEEDLAGAVHSKIKKGHAIVHIEDLTSKTASENLVRAAMNSFGKIDAIVNNAAWVVSSNIETTDPDLLRRVFDINTVAPFALIRSAMPYMVKEGGAILNIGSVNAWCGEPNLLAYSISKGALTTLTRNLGDTLFREAGIRVNQINPGWVLTEREIERKKSQGLPDDWYKKIPRVFAPSGRLITPAEIAAAAVYWLSDESGPVTGQIMDLEQYPMLGRNPPKELH